jgi:UDP-N-acetyl-D-galactosamine dehydrogenase
LSVQLQFKTSLAVLGHSQFVALGASGIAAFAQEKSVIFDVKGILSLGAADGRL